MRTGKIIFRRIAAFLFILFLTTIRADIPAYGDTLLRELIEFTIQADKEIYRPGEKISVDLQITNILEEPLQVIDLNKVGRNVMSSQTLMFRVTGPDGNEVSYQGAMEDWGPGFEQHGRWLKPQESMHFAIVINDDKAVGYYSLSQQGRYQIIGLYYGVSDTQTTNRLKILSNTISVNIGGDM